MNIGWSSEAINDLVSLRSYIAEDHPAAAERITTEILRSIDLLSDQPHMGRAGRVPGTRELVIPRTPFIMPYQVWNGRIVILRVYHSARRWPETF